MQWFKKGDDGQVRFTGQSLEVHVPLRYEQHGCLNITDVVEVMAIFDMIVDEKVHVGFLLPSIIITKPSNTEPFTTEDGQYLKLIYQKNDVFMTSTELVKRGLLGYVMFYEFLYLGKRPKFIGYEKSAKVFDQLKSICGVNLPVNQSVFEMISAHLHRDQDDLKVLYRYTNMKNPPASIPLLDVSHAAISTTAKLVGSYFNAAVDSALVNASDHNARLEDLLRL